MAGTGGSGSGAPALADDPSVLVADEFPLVHELTPVPDCEHVFRRLGGLPHCLWLDSSLRHPQLGRYSFLAADPCQRLRLEAADGSAERILRAALHRFRTSSEPGLPPFQGGFAGLFAYEWGGAYERLPRPRHNEFCLPALVLGLYDLVFAWDHTQDRAWLLSQGFPETDPALRRRRAQQRLQQALEWLCRPADGPKSTRQVRLELTAPHFDVPGRPGLLSNFSADGYCRAVQRARDYIYAGDVFQVNLSQRLLHPAGDDSARLYRRLRQRTPATFAAYFDAGDFQVLSASPERFMHVRQGLIETRPIKGTRQALRRPEADLFAAAALKGSEKDRAENIMIVDLLRNDLSRVCTDESVCVPQLCEVEAYGYVQHLVSSVCGELRHDSSLCDVIAAAFPGGSITGAPKVRAMEIITELEDVARGAYCGSLGYVGFDGAMDLSILIRTITAAEGWWQFPVGGGVVAQSVPKLELDETWHKAAGLLRALDR